jgi:hypothetical protein
MQQWEGNKAKQMHNVVPTGNFREAMLCVWKVICRVAKHMADMLFFEGDSHHLQHMP